MTGAEIAIISMAAAGTVLSAYGQYQQGKMAEQEAQAAAKQACAQAAWHDYNAKIAQREAEAERQATTFEVQQHERQAKQLLARQRTLIGKAGVKMEGSPLLVAEDTAAQLVLESANIRMTGARRAEAYRSQSILDISKAKTARSRGAGYSIAAKDYRRAGLYGAGTSILGGAADVGYMGYKMGVWK